VLRFLSLRLLYALHVLLRLQHGIEMQGTAPAAAATVATGTLEVKTSADGQVLHPPQLAAAAVPVADAGAGLGGGTAEPAVAVAVPAATDAGGPAEQVSVKRTSTFELRHRKNQLSEVYNTRVLEREALKAQATETLNKRYHDRADKHELVRSASPLLSVSVA
jgi:hypothetical protein